MPDPDPPEVVVTVEEGEAAERARADAEAAQRAGAQAIADAAHVAAQAQVGASERVEEIAEDTLEELNESERRLSTWLQENQAANLNLHQETRQEIQNLKTETATAITSILTLLETLRTPPPQEGQQPPTAAPDSTRTAPPVGSGDQSQGQGQQSKTRRVRKI